MLLDCESECKYEYECEYECDYECDYEYEYECDYECGSDAPFTSSTGVALPRGWRLCSWAGLRVRA